MLLDLSVVEETNNLLLILFTFTSPLILSFECPMKIGVLKEIQKTRGASSWFIV